MRAAGDFNKATVQTKEAEIGELISIPKAEIIIEEIYREDGSRRDSTNVCMRSHIFVHLVIEGENPTVLVPSSYELELLLHGKPVRTECVQDLQNWQLTERREGTNRIEHFPLQSLAHDLPRGRPVEGWLHFTITEDVADYNVLRCNARLVVNTPIGPVWGETDGDCWNYHQAKSITHK